MEEQEVVNTIDLIRTAYLRTVGRVPSQRESQRAAKHIDDAESVSEGMRDLMWVLLNTKEFILNR